MRRRRFIALSSLLGLSFSTLSKTQAAATVSPAADGMQAAIAAIKTGETQSTFWDRYRPSQSFGSSQIPITVLIATHGPLGLLKSAIALGADPNARSSVGLTALKAALLRPSFPMAEWLHSHGANFGVKGRHSELDAATIGGDEDCIDFALSSGEVPSPSAIALALISRRYRIAESYWRLMGATDTCRQQVFSLVRHRTGLGEIAMGWKR